MAVLITGVAGFIGCNLAKKLLSQGHVVYGVDNLCRGNLNNLRTCSHSNKFSMSVVDMSDYNAYLEAVAEFSSTEAITEVWHLAANSDIPAGVEDSSVDLKDTFMTTFNTLKVMKEFDIPVIAFASSSAIYGDLGERLLVEDIGPLLPISNYGAMKLASEALISAAAESHLKRVFIFRFPNVIGIPATHGVMLDFVRRLKAQPEELFVLGNGTQQKGYLHVDDLIEGMFFIKSNSAEKVAIYNIGAGDIGVSVRSIAEELIQSASPEATIKYGEGNRGWVGDVPRFQYSVEKLSTLGWKPTLDSKQAVTRAIAEIIEQEAGR
jgi:UDP-glucose 4-epimerase